MPRMSRLAELGCVIPSILRQTESITLVDRRAEMTTQPDNHLVWTTDVELDRLRRSIMIYHNDIIH